MGWDGSRMDGCIMFIFQSSILSMHALPTATLRTYVTVQYIYIYITTYNSTLVSSTVYRCEEGKRQPD